MQTITELERRLEGIDGKGYGAYKSIAGSYREKGITLFLDHIQADPYAPPSAVRIRVDNQLARWPETLLSNESRRVALEDYLARGMRAEMVRQLKEGQVRLEVNRQCVLPRTSLRVDREGVEARLAVSLPAAGRTVLGRSARDLFQKLMAIAQKTLTFLPSRRAEYEAAVQLAEDQEYVRQQLQALDLVAFVANGSLLPRESGISDRPLSGGIPFLSPPSLEVEINTRHHGILRGMGIPPGVTLIVGGGYHGKSTLLRALQEGVYNHRARDGREWCITRNDAVKIRAEDGRAVTRVDISMFIDNLPQEIDTRNFSTSNASGSTSMAAGIVEALESGSHFLLIDEDTSATNFMIRDSRMQRLVNKCSEPITPLIDQIQHLYQQWGVSTILVMGGSGDYFDVADLVIMMDEYRALDVTARAREIATQIPSNRQQEARLPATLQVRRYQEGASGEKGEHSRVKITREAGQITVGQQIIDISALEQLIDPGQARTIGHCLRLMGHDFRGKTIPVLLDMLEEKLNARGMDDLGLHGYPPGDLVRPRRYEIAAALSRVRGLVVE